MNRRVRQLAGVLAACLLFLQAAAVGALAADETYQIRIFAGNVGATVGGGTVLQLTRAYGEDITFDPSWVKLPAGSPYYVRGVRKSGLDNNTVSNNVIHVTEDADYVVAYGIRGKLVSYTVNYVDRSGSTLAPSQTYYGNAGDKPVVAYLYVDDYLPQAYNLTRTLSENEAANVFTFVYSRIVRPTPQPVAAPAATAAPAAGTAAAGATPAAGTASGEGAAAGQGAAAPAAPTSAPAAAPNPPEEVPEEQVPLEEGPADLIDLDEEDTPLGKAPDAVEEKTDLQKDREQKRTKFYVALGLLAAALAVMTALLLVLLKKRGKQP